MGTILTILLAALALPAWATSAHFVRIQPDQSVYETGSKAILFAYVDRPPTEATKEFFTSLKMAGESVKMIPLSDRLLVGLPNRFSEPGNITIESNIFLQTKAEQLQLAQSAAFYQKQIDGWAKQLEGEQDPDIRASLERLIAKEQFKLRAVKDQIQEQRTLVEVGQFRLLVTPPSRQKKFSTFSVTADRAPAEYFVGERAVFTAHLNTLFTGPDGPKETVVRGKIGEATIAPPVRSGDDFTFTSSPFSALQIGLQTFTVKYLVRSQAQSEILRDAASLAGRQKRGMEKKLAESVVPEEQAYLEAKIAEINQIIAAISIQLEEILAEVDEVGLNLTVLSGGQK